MRKPLFVIVNFVVVLALVANLFPSQAVAEVTQTAIRERTKQLLDNQGKSAKLSKAEIDKLIADFQELPETIKCDERRLNLAARQEFYRVNHNEFTDAYEQIYENAKQASARFLDLRFDTKKLDNKIANLEDDIFSFKSSYFSLIDNLEANLAIACDDNFGKTNTLGDGKTFVIEMQQKAKEIRKQALEVLSEMQNLKKIKE